MILLSHSGLLIFQDRSEGILYFIKFFGTIGVDLFFVLSGFLIGNLIIKQIESGKTTFSHFLYFWVRRWFKTLPNYFLILIINILLLLSFSGDIVTSNASYFFFVQNFSDSMPDFFTESWSLSIEEFSYIIGPLLLFFLLLTKNPHKKYLFFSVTILMILLGIFFRNFYHLNFNNIGFEDWSHNLRKVVIYRIDSIYYGFLGAFIYSYYINFWKSNKEIFLVLGIFSFIIMHAVMYLFNYNPVSHPFFYNQLYLPILLLSLLLLFPYIAAISIKYSRVVNVITYISLISYSMYLVNYSLILLTMQNYLDISDFSFIGKTLTLISFWCLTFLFSHLLYRYYERPIMNFRDTKFIQSVFEKP